MPRLLRIAPFLAALSVVAWLASCGGDGGTTDPPSPPPPSNQAPTAVGSVSPQTITAGESAAVNVSSNFTDPDGDALTYTAATSDAGVATASVAGSTVTISAAAAGSATVTVTATDPGGLSATQTISVTVEAANQAPEPVGSLEDQTLAPGGEVTVDVADHFSDPDGDALTYSATTSDAGVATASAEGSAVTITAAAAGSATVTVTATDPGGLSATQAISVTVEAVNQAPVPVGEIPALTLTRGLEVAFDVSSNFSDPDGDPLAISATSSDAGVATASAEGSTVTISAAAAGSATVTVTATDPGGLSATQEVTVTVEEPMSNRAPVMADDAIPFPAHDMIVDSAVVLDAAGYFVDPDGDELTYTAMTSDEAVAAAMVSGSTVTTMAVSAVEDEVLNVILTVTATDPEGLSLSQEADVLVAAVDYEPYDGLELTDDGRVFALGAITLGYTACVAKDIIKTFGNFIVHWTEWQQKKGSGWIRVPGTRREPTEPTDNAICGYDFTDDAVEEGTYRLTGEMSLPDDAGNNVRGRYKTENDYTHIK